MEAVGGILALTISSAPREHDEVASHVVASGVDACAPVEADCSFERGGVMVQAKMIVLIWHLSGLRG
jgi:hypothetical protein